MKETKVTQVAFIISTIIMIFGFGVILGSDLPQNIALLIFIVSLIIGTGLGFVSMLYLTCREAMDISKINRKLQENK